MKEQIIRKQYRAILKENTSGERLNSILYLAKENILRLIEDNKVMTACVFKNNRDIFVYYETIDIELEPKDIFGDWNELLDSWPGESRRIWVYMYPVFYHTIPKDKEDWQRTGKAQKRGRIAYLNTENMFEYVYHHVAIAKEGYLAGDKYQLISLHENILFSYLEEPRTPMNVVRDLSVESEKIKDWIAVNPTSHFIMKPGQKEHFEFIETMLSLP